MPRPENSRIVLEPPLFGEFKPVGVPGGSLQQILLSLDEYEAIRLADHKGYSHEEASEEMEISRSTFSRLIDRARKKIAEFLIGGKILSIEGGSIHFRNNIIQCTDCGHMFKTKIGLVMDKCPECGLSNLLSLAGGFGHGACCLRNSNRSKPDMLSTTYKKS